MASVKFRNIEKKFKANGNTALKEWSKKTSIQGKAKPVMIAIAGKYTAPSDAYISILKALEHCSSKLNRPVKAKWIDTTRLEDKKDLLKKQMKGVDGVIVPGGFGTRGIEGKIAMAKYCRENNIPYLGLCLGFQIVLIEFARNVLGLKDANSTEFDSKTKNPVICLLPEQREIEGLGGSMRLGGRDVEVIGGTIASRIEYSTGAVFPAFSPGDMVNSFPELSDIATISGKKIFDLFSEDMSAPHWKIIVKHVAKEIKNKAKGVVLMHGTDTMHYTSAALSFMLQNLPVPVVLVGAQRSSDRGSSDNAMNLISSVLIAAGSDIAEVSLCMHGSINDDYSYVHQGTKVRKMHTSRRDAFRSIRSEEHTSELQSH